MKLNFVAIVLFQLVGLNSSAAKICKEICTGIRQELLSESHTCSPALTINPSPAVYKSCQHGKKAAFAKTCVSLCSKDETTTKSQASLASDACRSTKGRGAAEYWCKRGFSSILKKLETYNFQVSDSTIDDDEISKEPDDEEEVVSSGEVIPQVDQAEVETNSREGNKAATDNVETLSMGEPKHESIHEEEPKDEEETEGGVIEEEPKEEVKVVQGQEFVSEKEDNEDATLVHDATDATHSEEAEEVAGEVEYDEDEF